ncbi:ribosomal L7Ae/L30e/S12e/Gadd45 family protein [Clostridium sp. MSJ-11]|uniref:Ribosomal L7Ae/L30e/S12e/Gadd45 family protein n=1 Tax=Clostridium mobile TaxID=2841512 RepID=A0ABS6EE64_9CLOT|nr:ribosomal L7Ae/L30e/S12e/Gadd45 family protein [Clostridium mobile]MBU5482785.1 ribosomal L7Ae/L30e/S12e/Gadd45 family protein [Clostridium mobile]
MKDKFISFLGIAKKAGKCLEGYNKCEDSIKKGNCHLLIVSRESSENTKDKFKTLCDIRNTPMIIYYSKDDLSNILGKEGINIVGISDLSIAKRLMDLWNDMNIN